MWSRDTLLSRRYRTPSSAIKKAMDALWNRKNAARSSNGAITGDSMASADPTTRDASSQGTVAAGLETRGPQLFAAGFFADEGAEVSVEFFLVGGDVVDAAQIITRTIEEVGAFVAFAHDFRHLMFAAANARAGDVVVVFDFDPIFDCAAF